MSNNEYSAERNEIIDHELCFKDQQETEEKVSEEEQRIAEMFARLEEIVIRQQMKADNELFDPWDDEFGLDPREPQIIIDYTTYND